MQRAAAQLAGDALARRATQCSFSSAFHVPGQTPRAQKAVSDIYSLLLAPPIVLMGAYGLWRLS